MDRVVRIRKMISRFPDKPGVYLMHNAEGNVIYIGKAKSLKKRVSSYFRHSNYASPRLKKLVNNIFDITTIRTETEAEALIVESRLIKKFKPFFNVELKMGDRYPYVKITNERYPRIVVTRHRDDDGSRYIGPFTKVGELRKMLRLVECYFPLRSCSGDLLKPTGKRPCLMYEIGRCLAPCMRLCSPSDYRERVDDVVLLLQGNTLKLVERVKRRMEDASVRMAFEEASMHRDTIRALRRFTHQRISSALMVDLDEDMWNVLIRLQYLLDLPTVPWRIDGFDISHFSGNEMYGVVVVFEQGISNPGRYRTFEIRSVEDVDDFRSIRETVYRRYRRCIKEEEPLPQLILIDGGPEQLVFAREALSRLELGYLPIIALAKREELIFLPDKKEPLKLDHDDPVLYLLQRVRDESHRFAITNHRKKRGGRLKRSILEDIPGIGKHKAALLLSTFGSIQRIAELCVDDLVKISGIGPGQAKTIAAFFREGKNEGQPENDG